MRKFTFISEYKGGTYISQYTSEDLCSALNKWSINLDPLVYSKDDILQLLREIKNEDYMPVAIDVVENVWCCSFLSDESFLLLNIVETA